MLHACPLERVMQAANHDGSIDLRSITSQDNNLGAVFDYLTGDAR